MWFSIRPRAQRSYRLLPRPVAILVTMKRTSTPWSPASTRTMMRRTRDQLSASAPMERLGAGQAEDVAVSFPFTPVHDLRAGIMAVTAQGDPDHRPVGPDASDHALEQGQDLPAARPFGGTQHGRDQPAAGIEDHDRLKAVLVVVGIEQLKLLGAMGGVEGIVQIEHDAIRDLRK